MRTRHLLLLLSLLLSGCVFRWLKHPAARASFEGVHEVPLRLFGSTLLVQASLDDGAPVWFFVDTGAPISAIDPSLVESAADARHSKIKIGVGGATEGRSSSRVVNVDGLKIGDVTFDRVIAIELDMSPIEEVLGIELGGILGLSVFEEFLLTLDYPNQRMLLRPGELPGANQKDILSYQLSQQHMMIPLTYQGKTVKVAIDSGCNSAIYLPNEQEGVFSFSTGPRIAGTALGATGESEVRAGRVSGQVAMGEFTIKDPLITFAQTDLALLGGPILRHFALTIDQKNQRVRFVQGAPSEITIPALRKFISLKKKGGQWIIDAVRESNTSLLAAGDIIVSVNDQDASRMDYSEWEVLIESEAPVKMVLLRAGQQIELLVQSEVIIP